MKIASKIFAISIFLVVIFIGFTSINSTQVFAQFDNICAGYNPPSFCNPPPNPGGTNTPSCTTNSDGCMYGGGGMVITSCVDTCGGGTCAACGDPCDSLAQTTYGTCGTSITGGGGLLCQVGQSISDCLAWTCFRDYNKCPVSQATASPTPACPPGSKCDIDFGRAPGYIIAGHAFQDSDPSFEHKRCKGTVCQDGLSLSDGNITVTKSSGNTRRIAAVSVPSTQIHLNKKYDSNMNLVDETGSYVIDGLGPGVYTVTFRAPDGWVSTTNINSYQFPINVSPIP